MLTRIMSIRGQDSEETSLTLMHPPLESACFRTLLVVQRVKPVRGYGHLAQGTLCALIAFADACSEPGAHAVCKVRGVL